MIRRMPVILAFIAAAVIVTPAPAQARICKIDHECYTTFYSDSSHTTVVGTLYENCQSEPTMRGVRSSFWTFREHP